MKMKPFRCIALCCLWACRTAQPVSTASSPTTAQTPSASYSRPPRPATIDLAKPPLRWVAFLTGLHHQIHPLWTALWTSPDRSRANDPFRDQSLWACVEVVVDSDGRVERASIVRSSGLAAYDELAAKAFHDTGPFPAPPSELKSADGKAHLHWNLHRDENACGTWLLDPYLLKNTKRNERGLDEDAPPCEFRGPPKTSSGQ